MRTPSRATCRSSSSTRGSTRRRATRSSRPSRTASSSVVRTVLCYGDSNTWGCVPLVDMEPASRFGPHERWPGVLRRELGPGYWVVEEGLNGRTTVHDDDEEGPGRNGATLLVPLLETHQPVDVVVLMLGTNDLKAKFDASPEEIAEGVGALVDLVRVSSGGAAPDVLLVCPPPVARLSQFAEKFAGAGEKSRELAAAFAEVARARGCAFLDAGERISSSDVDGIHLDLAAHETLGSVVAGAIRESLARPAAR